jgi:L-ribulokinase
MLALTLIRTRFEARGGKPLMSVESPDRYTIGVDVGTLSGRAVVVRVADGAELGTAVHEHPHAVPVDALPDGTRLGPDRALQVPADDVEVLRTAVPEAMRAAGIDPAQVIGIATDFTAGTMVPARSDGTPLNELEEFRSRPHAYAARPAAIKRRAGADGTSGSPAGFDDPDAEATSWR